MLYIILKIVIIALAFMFGASLASFFGVVFERIPKGESINGRSHCACGRPLKWYENIPVIGYLAIKGRAKCCGAKLPISYLVSELITGTIFAVIVFTLL